MLSGEKMRKEKDKIDTLLEKYEKQMSNLIPILQEIQNLRGYLRKEDLVKISQKTKIPLAKIYGAVTFYKNFHLKD